MTNVTPDTIAEVAKLARLALTEAQVGQFAGEIDSILGYIQQLVAVDVSNVEPLDHPWGLVGVVRADEPRESLPADAALMNTARTGRDFFIVPAVFDSGA